MKNLNNYRPRLLMLKADTEATKMFMKLCNDLEADGFVDVHAMRLLLQQMLEAGVPACGAVDAALHLTLPHRRPKVLVWLGEFPELPTPEVKFLIMGCDDDGLDELQQVTKYIDGLCISVSEPDPKRPASQWDRSYFSDGQAHGSLSGGSDRISA